MSRVIHHLVACSVAFAASSGAGAEDVAADAWDRQPEVRELYEKAKAEGRVVLWGVQQREVDWEQAPFAERFPGIRIEWYADANIATKAIAEARGGRHAVDVVHAALGTILPLVDRKLLQPVRWSQFGVAAESTAFDARAAFTHSLVYTFAYNTRLVAQQELPRTWDDLLDPRWRGRLAASQFVLPRMIATLGLQWGEAKAVAYARALVDRNAVMITRAPRESFVQSGERVASIGEPANSARLWAAQGLSIGHVFPTPVGAAQVTVAVMADAPHPHAARLLAGWMASRAGKQARDRLRHDVDVGPGADNATYRALVAQGATFVHETAANVKQREALFRKLIPIVGGQDR